MNDPTFRWAADVLNMGLTGADPGPLHSNQPRHVHIIGSADLNTFVRGLVPNVPDEEVSTVDEFGTVFTEPPDAWNETTDERRSWRLALHFDAETELEVRLAVMAIDGFIRRRTTLNNVVSVLTED